MISKYTVELNDKRHPILVEEESYDYDSREIASPEQIVMMMNNIMNFSKKAEEYTYMVSFSSAFEVLGIFEISHGNINFSMLPPREIMIRALLSGASGVVIVHNHPSGRTEPSKGDVQAFEKLKEIIELFDMTLHDFIVIGDGFYSFKKEDKF